MRDEYKKFVENFVKKNGKTHTVDAGDITIITSDESIREISEFLLSKKWEILDEVVIYNPANPFNSSLLAQENCCKLTTFTLNKRDRTYRITLINGMIPPGIHAMDETSYVWNDAKCCLYIFCIMAKKGGLLSKMFSNSSSEEAFAQDPIFKGYTRYMCNEPCNCPRFCRVPNCICQTNNEIYNQIETNMTNTFGKSLYKFISVCKCEKCKARDVCILKLNGVKSKVLTGWIDDITTGTSLFRLQELKKDFIRRHTTINSAKSKIGQMYQNAKSNISDYTDTASATDDQNSSGFGFGTKLKLAKSLFS